MRGRRPALRAWPALVLALGACAHRGAQAGGRGTASSTGTAAAPPSVVTVFEPPSPAPAPTAQAPVAGAAKPAAAPAKRAATTKPAAKVKPAPAKAAVASAPKAPASQRKALTAAPQRLVQARTGARVPSATSWSAEGCLTAKDEPGAQAFAKERHAAQGPAVTLEKRPGGVVLVHRLAHACCLSAEVTSRVEGGRYVVTERLTGKACRCVCDSTIRTELAPAPGTHPLVLDLYTSGSSRRAFEGTVEVR